MRDADVSHIACDGGVFSPISFKPAITSTSPSAFKTIGAAKRIPNVVPAMAPKRTAAA